MDPNALTRIDDGPIIAGLNQAWAAAHPNAAALVAADPGDNAAGSRDDAFPLWLNDRSAAATTFVRDYLMSHSATGTTYNAAHPAQAGSPRTLAHSGLTRGLRRTRCCQVLRHAAPGDPRHPDVWGVVQHGVVYTGGVKKIAEHGGAGTEDRNVPIVVYSPQMSGGAVSPAPVETTQIAPTILQLLHINPNALQAVRIEGTAVLPGL